MNKKKKVTIGIICCSIIIFAVVGILIYIHLLPYIRLKKTVDNLLNKQYEYKVEGMDLPLLGNSFQGKINGEKGKNVVYGDISYKDSTYLKLYADKNGEIIFDAGPVIKAAINKARVCKKPIAGYDKENKKAYIEYANGDIKYAK